MNFTLDHIPETDSTNAEAIRRYQSKKLVSPLIITTDFQTAGKGYENNYWESEKGQNLLFSLVFKPDLIEPQEQFLLTMITSLSLHDTLQKYLSGKLIKVKWPNDIYVGDKKIAGILIQNFIKSQEIDATIIGVGLNINQSHFLKKTPNPTSIYLETGQTYPPAAILRDFLSSFNEHYLLAATNPEKLKNKYLNHLYRYHEEHDFLLPDGQKIRGKIKDVSPYGQLIIETAQKQVRTFNFKEIEFII